MFLNFPSQWWSSMSVCILSKGVSTASVHPAQKAASTTLLETVQSIRTQLREASLYLVFASQ